MTDHLHPVLDDAAIARMTSLALAHVGDAVYEILVRTHLACGGTQTAKNLHSRTIQLVRASAQAEAVKRIQPMLDEDEQTVLRHGRNAKPKSVPKSASVAEYAYATALEALFGWLYLKGRYERINELFEVICSCMASSRSLQSFFVCFCEITSFLASAVTFSQSSLETVIFPPKTVLPVTTLSISFSLTCFLAAFSSAALISSFSAMI